MKETIECCGKPVEIDHERDIVVCRECGKILYKRITDYNRMYVNKYKYIGFNFTGLLNNVENSRYALTQGFTNYNAINAFANYDFSIGKHDISIMGGYNQEESHKESQWSQRTDVLLENLPSLSGSH